MENNGSVSTKTCLTIDVIDFRQFSNEKMDCTGQVFAETYSIFHTSRWPVILKLLYCPTHVHSKVSLSYVQKLPKPLATHTPLNIIRVTKVTQNEKMLIEKLPCCS